MKALAVVIAFALLSPGAVRPVARVTDADGRVLDLHAVKNKPALILYEDRDSSKVNAAFKADLAQLARGDRYRGAVVLVPVADVQGFDYWPVRGFVKDAIRDESKKVGNPIYCDFDGAFQRALGFRRGTSSVLLIGKDARVRFAVEGQLTTEQRAEVLTLLRSEIEAPPLAER